jgi:acetylornithine deacetylase
MSALAILERLIAQPTIAGTSNESLIAELAERLQALGAQVNVVASVREDARNLHAVLGPADAEGGILLAAHSDVVDVAGQPWTRDPFVLGVEGGRAYGRGSTDMKGFIAALLSALEDQGPKLTGRLRHPVHIAISSDEELGCRGVGPLLDVLAALPVRPAWALVGEPTELEVVDRHKGKAAARVQLQGVAAHSSVPADGVNAVAHAGLLITRLLALAEELRWMRASVRRSRRSASGRSTAGSRSTSCPTTAGSTSSCARCRRSIPRSSWAASTRSPPRPSRRCERSTRALRCASSRSRAIPGWPR